MKRFRKGSVDADGIAGIAFVIGMAMLISLVVCAGINADNQRFELKKLELELKMKQTTTQPEFRKAENDQNRTKKIR